MPRKKQERFGVLGRKGVIDFYMDGLLSRSKPYKSPGERNKIINDWLHEIKPIKEKYIFHYHINPQLKAA